VKSPKPNKRTNHHKPKCTTHKKLMLASKKLLQRKKLQSPQPDGVKKRKPKKVNTITCQPIHLNAAETPNSIQKGTCSTYPNRHTPTNKPTKRLIGRQTNQHTTMHTKNKKYIGTLLSSQTSSPTNKN